MLNVSNLARECQTGRGIVTGYIDILEDLLLAYRLPVFAKRAKRKTASHPKFYLFDNGLYRRLRQRGPLDIESEISGAALEGLVGQHLRAYSDYALPDTKLFYWRTLAGNEVDFVLYGGDTFAAVEVKNARTLNPSDYNGLVSFGDDYAEASPSLGTGSLTVRNDQRVFPFGRFLRKKKLNELLRIFNILPGDRAIVGPGPRMEVDFVKYPDFMLVFLTAWVILFPHSGFIHKIFSDLPARPEYLD